MAAVFGLEPALLTFGGIFAIGRVAEAMMSGFNKSITVLVLSRKRTHIATHVRDELGRRASVLQNIEDEKTSEKDTDVYCEVTGAFAFERNCI